MLLNTWLLLNSKGVCFLSNMEIILLNMPSLFLSFITVNVTDCDLRHVTNNWGTLLFFCVGNELCGYLFPTPLSLPPLSSRIFSTVESQACTWRAVISQTRWTFPLHCWSSHLCNALSSSWCKKSETDRLMLGLVLLSSAGWEFFKLSEQQETVGVSSIH